MPEADVQKGDLSFFFLSDCKRLNVSSCFALNADSPYGLVVLPPSPKEHKEFLGCTKDTRTGAHECGNGFNPRNDAALFNGFCSDKNYPMRWRLGADEAVVLVGRSPPKCTYWSITG
jgi:hypothetical protein